MTNTIQGYLPIINPGKCGSSWLSHALTIRPYITFPREFDFIYFLRFSLSNQWNTVTVENPAYLKIREDPVLTQDEKLVQLYQLERAKYPKKTLIIDKAPSNAYGGFELFHHLYRDTKIILLYRDPRDIYVSNEFYHQRQLGKKGHHNNIGDPEFMATQSVLHPTFNSCKKVFSIEKLLKRENRSYLKISYEEMKADFRAVIEKILAYLDLRISPFKLVSSHYVKVPVPLSVHISKAENFKPLFRKGQVGDWQNHITHPKAKDIIKEQYGNFLIELGYEKDHNW